MKIWTDEGQVDVHIQDVPVKGVVCFIGEYVPGAEHPYKWHFYFFPYIIRQVVNENGYCCSFPIGISWPEQYEKLFELIDDHEYRLVDSIGSFELRAFRDAWEEEELPLYDGAVKFLGECKRHGVFIEESAEYYLNQLKKNGDTNT